VTIKKVLEYQVDEFRTEELRIDKWLSQFEELGSRTRVLELIASSCVHVNGKVVSKPSFKVKSGMLIQVELPEAKPLNLVPNHLPLDIVFEDRDLIVINKPAGLVVHPSAGHNEDSLVHRVLGHCELSSGVNNDRPGVVHRLDKDTSGLIVLAKSNTAHRHLSEQFKMKSAYRIYEAICFGNLEKKSGTIESYLSRHPVDRKRRASVRDINKQIIRKFHPEFARGKWAVTHFRELQQDNSKQLSLVELRLETGRTHQIRVHLSEMGHPIVGDELYGASKRINRIKGSELLETLKQVSRVLLHAKELGFLHPSTEEPMRFRRDWPSPILELRQKIFFSKS
jgi:23S rRNA pseudouridine1911/1915/1917 synthase